MSELLTLESIRGAVARGWCHEDNREKEFDGALGEAISQEIAELLSVGGARPVSPDALDCMSEREKLIRRVPGVAGEADVKYLLGVIDVIREDRGMAPVAGEQKDS